MEKEIYNSYLLVNGGQLRNNIRSILDSLPEGTQLIPMLKCNAYGLGLEYVSRVISEFNEIKMIALAQVMEALELRRLGFEREILVTGAAVGGAQRRSAIENNITLAAYSADFIRALCADAGALGKKARVHIKINCGLNRLGAAPGAELKEVAEVLKSCAKWVEVCGTFSHFSELEEPRREDAEREFEIFSAALCELEAAGIKPGMRHICASAAYEFYPQMALDAVRIGRRLYYDSPVCPDGGVADCASWRALISDVRLRRAGQALGYGGGCMLEKDKKIALLGIGYGDGLSKELVHKNAEVLVCGKRAKLLCCCMDQCFIDVSGIDCRAGDEVTLFGYDGEGRLLGGQSVAALINDEGCSLTSALGARVARVYED